MICILYQKMLVNRQTLMVGLFFFRFVIYLKIIKLVFNYFFIKAPEGRRSSGLAAIWVARNRFAVLDKNHTVK
jgi:hypothetical protein